MYRYGVLKIPWNQWKCWCMPDVKFWRDFKEKSPAVKSIVLTPMLWKRPNPTWQIASVSVRQGPSHRPSLADWRRGCHPEGTRVIPRERYASSLCPQILKNWKIERFYSYRILFLILPDPKFFVAIDWVLLYSCRIRNIRTGSSSYSNRVLFYSCRIRNIHNGSSSYSYRVQFYSCQIRNVCTGSEFIKLLLTIPKISNIITS